MLRERAESLLWIMTALLSLTSKESHFRVLCLVNPLDTAFRLNHNIVAVYSLMHLKGVFMHRFGVQFVLLPTCSFTVLFPLNINRIIFGHVCFL